MSIKIYCKHCGGYVVRLPDNTYQCLSCLRFIESK